MSFLNQQTGINLQLCALFHLVKFWTSDEMKNSQYVNNHSLCYV